MTRVPKNVSRRERFPPRKTEDASPAADPAAAGEGVSGGGGGKRPNRQPPWEKEAVPTESGSFGDWLRRQRELREISLRDIAERTKISQRYLEAMEQDRFDLLPAPLFAKGFLREYARYVGLSPDEVVNHYLAVQQQESPEEDGVKKDQTLVNRPHRVKPVRSWTYGLFLAVA